MENPFVYGEVVAGADFCDRERERADLARDLKSGERVFLISPRRFGKSSLISDVCKKLKREGFLVAYIDLFKVSSLNQFLETYSQSLSRAAESSLTGFSKFVKDFLAGIRPKVVIGSDGQPKIEIGFDMNKKEVFSHLGDVYDLPQKIAQKRRKRFIVVFDEFQEIQAFGGEKIEKAMRAVFQRQPLVSYLFSGSKRHLMYSMVSDRNRAFYKMGRIMTLEKLPPDIFAAYLLNKFKKTGYRIEAETVSKILALAEGYPYNTQFICHKLWDIKFESKTIRAEDLNAAMEAILKDQEMAYIALWDKLSNHQKKLMAAIAEFGGENILRSEFIRLGELAAPSSVQTSKTLLLKRDLLDKENGRYFIADTFFKEWIMRRMVR